MQIFRKEVTGDVLEVIRYRFRLWMKQQNQRKDERP